MPIKKTTNKKVVTPAKQAATKPIQETTKKVVTKSDKKTEPNNGTNNTKSLPIDHFITKDDAIRFVGDATSRNTTPAIDYPKAIIEEILNQEGVVGIRIYNAINNEENTFVITGYDADKNDVYISRNGQQGAADLGQPCDPGMPSYQQTSVHMLFNS